jgi:hypothetical protein
MRNDKECVMPNVLTILALTGLAFIAADGPASLLRPGMELVYSSNGQDQPAWRIDSVRHDQSLRPGSVCTVVFQRRMPQNPAEEIRLCQSQDTLLSWNPERGEWRAQRPVGPNMSLDFTRPNGDRVRFETGDSGEEEISGRKIPVVATTVTTTDSTGRPKRRLRERYALGLATATGGVFEIPDSVQAGAWRAQQSFELREIRWP